MKRKISIIIPVYNGEKYIRRCLRSILKQTYLNLEVIVINDGSKDHSEEICREIAHKDKRVQVFTQPNGGSAKARRAGIPHTSGEYVMFMDVDDYYCKKDAVERVAHYLEQYDVDMLQFSYRKKLHFIHRNYPCTDHVMVMDRQEFMTDHYPRLLGSYYEGSQLSASNYDKVYRRTLLDGILGVDETKYIFMGDDVYLNLHMLQHVDSVCFVPDVLYSYQALTGGTKHFNTHYMDDYQVVKDNQLYFIQKYSREFPWKQDMLYYCHAETAWCMFAHSLAIAANFSEQEAKSKMSECLTYPWVERAREYFKTEEIRDTYAPTLEKIRMLVDKDLDSYYKQAIEINSQRDLKYYARKIL